MAIAGIVRLVTEAAADTVRPMVRETIRDAVRRAVLLAIALVLLAGVLIFAELAFYLWLRTQTTPYLAALIVAGVTMILALIFLLLALAGGSGGHKGEPAATPRPVSAATGEARGETTDPVARLAAEAEALGAMIGKDAKGYQLVLGALVVGLLLGRNR